MARSISVIQNAMIADIKGNKILNPGGTAPNLNSTSKRAIWLAMTFIFAAAVYALESIIDIFKTNTETTASQAAAATNAWLKAKAFTFQYDVNNPQIIQLIDTVPVYPTVDPTKCITSRCSVDTDLSNDVLIKVATQEPPIGFDSDQLAAMQSYFNTIGGAGITYTVSSGNADQLYIDADIYYDGQYQAVILTNITNALNAFLANLSAQSNFNSKVLMSDLENTIRAATGVNDVVLNNVKARQDSTPFSGGTFLIQNKTVISRYWPTVAGYIILETTAGETLATSLNLIAQ